MITLAVYRSSTVAVYHKGDCLDCFSCMSQATALAERLVADTGDQVEIVDLTGIDPTVGESVNYTLRFGTHSFARWVHNVRSPFGLRNKLAKDNPEAVVSFRKLAE